ncbi:MAG: hypothetical protein LBL92_06260, partial [Propionibacteriaceae bacterium]|nr:hypothetical protein [Propionibacteriaceae bacterium]
MDLREFLGTLLRHWLTIVLCIVVAMVASIGVTLLMTPQYKSSSVLYVMARTPGAQGTSDVLQGSNYARQAVLSYVQVIGDAIVLDPVIARLGLDMTAAELSSHVTATSPTNTVIINITATDDSPTLAADIANAVAQSLATVIMDELEKTSADTTELVKVTQTQQAIVPTSPSSPNLVLNLAIGLVAGLALGIGLAWLRSV